MHKKSTHASGNTYCNRQQIYSIAENDTIYLPLHHGAFEILFGVGMKNHRPDELNQISTIAKIERWWINHFKTTLFPTFPTGFTRTETRVQMHQALFIFSSKELLLHYGTKKFEVSHFSLMTPATLSSHIKSRLKRPRKMKHPSIFESHGFGEDMWLNPHQLRHFTNTVAYMSDIPIEIITAWSGRINSNQTHEYIHMSEEEKSSKINSILNFPRNNDADIRIITMNELSTSTNLPASITSTGVCMQELNISPCTYLNDFTSQCFMCPSTAYISGDKNAIEFLKKDLTIQEIRLNNAQNDPRIHNSQAMREWYCIHSINTIILSKLIELMNKQPRGTIIYHAINSNEFKLTDLSTGQIETVRLELPGTNEVLKQLDSKLSSSKATNNNGNTELNNLLANFGLQKQNH